MERIGDLRTETWIDKSCWEPGPWFDEPDRAEWLDQDTGLPCLVLRTRFGTLCGYVAVPSDHRWYGLPHQEVPASAHSAAHGGLTFAGKCMEDSRPLRERVCHTPRPGGSDDVWWLGFDCMHGGDRVPGLNELIQGLPNYHYRTLSYVQERCAVLAATVAEAS